MAMHRDLVKGTGFFETLRRRQVVLRGGLRGGLNYAMASLKIDDGPTQPLPALANVSYLPEAEDLVQALLEEALPEDRVRFRGYLSSRPLGLGLITAVSRLISLM